MEKKKNLSLEEKEKYILKFENAKKLENATEAAVELCREYIEELCTLDNVPALHMKGYSCYGGDRLYPCDWETSRDCMIRLFELTDDPGYANTLGYIYYYGRCTNGVPEYEKAFGYFGIAAANGLYEASYKLADMYYHGYACKKSPKTARNLYRMVYDDCLKKFLRGEHTTFADAALRMGNVYARGIGEDVDVELAYEYYLQAYYAAKLRAKESSFWGDAKVVENAERALEEIKEKLPEGYFKEYEDYQYPYFLFLLTNDNYRCELIKYKIGPRDWGLYARRISTNPFGKMNDVLIVAPEMNYCVRTHEVSMRAVNVSAVWFKDEGMKTLYDCCCYDPDEERHEFYYNGELIGWIDAESFQVEKREEDEELWEI